MGVKLSLEEVEKAEEETLPFELLLAFCRWFRCLYCCCCCCCCCCC